MWSMLDGLGRFIGLLSRTIQAAWDAWRSRERQRSADAIADDPAGEWMRRFNKQSNPTSPAKTDPGESDADS